MKCLVLLLTNLLPLVLGDPPAHPEVPVPLWRGRHRPRPGGAGEAQVAALGAVGSRPGLEGLEEGMKNKRSISAWHLLSLL